MMPRGGKGTGVIVGHFEVFMLEVTIQEDYMQKVDSLRGDPDPVRFHLFRHAESVANVSGTIGDPDTLLTLNGEGQVRALAAYIEQHPLAVDGVYCSTMLRARLTLDGLLPALGSDSGAVRYDKRLREIDRGDWNGVQRSTVYTLAEFARMDALGLEHCAPGGESLREVGHRMRDWLLDTLEEAKQRRWTSVMAVSHGLAIRYLWRELCDQDHRNLHTWRSVVDNTSVTTIAYHPPTKRFGQGTWALERFNATPHLPMNW